MAGRREFLKQSVIAGMAFTAGHHAFAGSPFQQPVLKAGLIGLDTSHSPAFTKLINDPANAKGVKVTHAYPFGSKRIESSASRIPQYTKEIQDLGVTVVDSLQKVIDASDVLMLMTNDGTLHLEQIEPVLRAGKPVYVDKPVAAGLPSVLKIYELARNHGVPIFSSSGLRYLEGAQKVRYENAIGKVTGAEAFSPQKTEPSHTDLYWYGIHGVEILYTIMGTGCKEIMRVTGSEQDLVIGKWEDGRIGTYKGDITGRQQYGGVAYGTEGTLSVGPFMGYKGLTDKIVEFFVQRKAPVDPEETLELYAFMEAADVSRDRKGAWVTLEEVVAASKQ